MSLTKFLTKKGYKKKNLKLTKTNHFKITAKINGIKGRFIVDTGASNTCLDFNLAEQFLLTPEETDTKAAGAGASEMETKIAKHNVVKIGKWSNKNTSIVLFDLSHVNQALINHNSKPVHGIIGSDILQLSNSVIDYKNNILFLK